MELDKRVRRCLMCGKWVYMRELFEITSKIGVHVIDLKKSVRKGFAQIQMTIEIQNTEALRLIQTGLESLRGVTEVRRR